MHRILFLLIIISVCLVVQGQNTNRKGCKIRDCSLKVKQQLKRPVCGSNNVTYENHCLFYNAECEAQRNGTVITLRYKGRCGSPRVKPKGKTHRRCSDPSQQCKPVRNLRNAVCGTNNVTYPSMCYFRVAKCEAKLKKEILGMKNRGKCGEPKFGRIPCPASLSQCSQERNQIQNHVCGSNGITYRNLCYFLFEQCRARRRNKKLRLKYKGSCGAPTTRKPCPTSCPTTRRAVCASDGKTYRNGCELAKFKCSLPKKQKRKLRVQYGGKCGERKPRGCLSIRKCRHKKGGPVCGTDGRTYPSKCHLRVVKCNMKRRNKSYKASISLKHMGPCKNVV